MRRGGRCYFQRLQFFDMGNSKCGFPGRPLSLSLSLPQITSRCITDTHRHSHTTLFVCSLAGPLAAPYFLRSFSFFFLFFAGVVFIRLHLSSAPRFRAPPIRFERFYKCSHTHGENKSTAETDVLIITALCCTALCVVYDKYRLVAIDAIQLDLGADTYSFLNSPAPFGLHVRLGC